MAGINLSKQSLDIKQETFKKCATILDNLA